MTTTEFNTADLAHFSGTTQYFKSCMFSGQQLVHTDGVQYVAENAGAYWLLDVFGTRLRQVAQWTVNCGGFAVLTLRANKTGNGAKVRMGDGNGNEKTLQAIPFTDFPFETFEGREFKMFAQWDSEAKRLVLMLPSEY